MSKKGNTILLVMILILSIAIIGLLFKGLQGSINGGKGQASWSSTQMRAYANKLKADGLTAQAVKAFEDYLANSNVDAKTRSNVYYSLGEMLVKAKQYDNALGYFYKAEVAYPETSLKAEIGSYIVECLENLGRSLDAEYQLESRAGLDSEEKKKTATGEVVAQIGKNKIYMGEINAELDKLPPWVKAKYQENPADKVEFLRQYVAIELLYDKGIKLGMAKSPQIKEQMDEILKQMVVQQVMKQEVTDKLTISDDDVKNYYMANQEKYKVEKSGAEGEEEAEGEEKEKIKPFEEIKGQVKMEYQQRKEQAMVQNVINKILKSKDVVLYEDKFAVTEKPAKVEEEKK